MDEATRRAREDRVRALFEEAGYRVVSVVAHDDGQVDVALVGPGDPPEERPEA